jgi:hypothetical protein
LSGGDDMAEYNFNEKEILLNVIAVSIYSPVFIYKHGVYKRVKRTERKK